MKHDLIHLQYILECIAKIEKVTKGKSRKGFEKLGIVKDGVFYNLQTMSESTQKLSKSLKFDMTDIPWQAIKGFRNRLVHEYLGIDMEAVWKVIKKELLPLKKRVEKAINFLENKNNS